MSHHVHPFPSSGDPDDGQVYLRVQEFKYVGCMAMHKVCLLSISLFQILPASQ